MQHSALRRWLTAGRRWVSLAGMRGAAKAGRYLSPTGALTLGRVTGQIAGTFGPLRERLVTNLRRAGIEPTPSQVDRYFRRFGCWAGWCTAAYNHGFIGSGVADRLTFDDSVARLDRAIALGRGVVIACPHAFCHELAAAAIHVRHPVAAVVREGKDPVREALKDRWYQAIGIETIRRSRRSSLLADTLAYLRVLRGGRALGITPDILVPREKGVPVRMFGRQVSLSPGMIVLAMRARAPLVACWYEWVEDRSGRRDDRLILRFDEPIDFPLAGDRDRTASEGMQEWSRRCEAFFIERPQDWMFWLDKSWTRALRAA